MKTSFRRHLGNFSLKKKALVIFLLFVILPTLGVGVVVQHKFNQILEERFINSTKRNLDNVTNQLEEQTAMVKDIANYLILSPDMRTFLRSSPPLTSDQKTDLKRKIEDFLTFQLMSKSYIRSIEISGLNGSLIRMGEPFYGDESRWMELARQRKGGIVWTEGYELNSGWNGRVRVLSLFRLLNSYSEITKPLGSLIIRLDEASIVELLEKGIFEEGSGSVFIVGDQGQMIMESKHHLPGAYVPDNALMNRLENSRNGFITARIEDKRYLTLYNRIENTDWTIISMIPEVKVNQEFRSVKILMIFIIAVIQLLGLTALIGFHYTIIRPILRLKKETNRVTYGDYNAQVPVNSRDEISELNRKFNEMVATIRELIEHKYKLELRQRESELKLMQNQMDPHFLYNTLDMIRWTARLEKASKSSRLIEMLSKFFRSSIDNGNYETSLYKEMEFVRSYLFLQQNRLGDKLQYALFMEAGIEQTPILKATIQPLVENFIKHGLDKKKPRYIVHVKCYKNIGEIWIDVVDNGSGMEPERKEEVQAALEHSGADVNRGGAMMNIHDRLSIYFGKGFGLQIVQTSTEGTWVRLRIPDAGIQLSLAVDENDG